MPLPPPETMEFNARRSPGRGYGVHDTHRLQPERLGDPLRETVRLLVDERSAAFGDLLADVRNLDVTLTRLPAGDLCATHGERALYVVLTTADEVARAMDDGRLARLVHALSRLRHPACMIVEGGMYATRDQPLARLAATHARLLYGVRISVLETIDRRHTAYMALCCIRDRFFPGDALGRFEPAPPRMPPSGPDVLARHLLEAIPGVSPGRAAALLERFGSIAGVATADERALSLVDGVGKVTARRILDTLGPRDTATADDDVDWGRLERL